MSEKVLYERAGLVHGIEGLMADVYNMDKAHAMVEMMLSSLYIDDYTTEERTLVASNRTLEYKYTKGPHGNMMVVRLLSLEEMVFPLIVRYGSPKFTTRNIDCHGILNIKGLN